jgi:hypothetical protein
MLRFLIGMAFLTAVRATCTELPPPPCSGAIISPSHAIAANNVGNMGVVVPTAVDHNL